MSGRPHVGRQTGWYRGSLELSSLLSGDEGFLFAGGRTTMTELLYHTDAYVKAFEATVMAVEGSAVALDRTAFYPGGGGQPNDVGTLTAGGQTWNVTKVRKAGAEVWHEVDSPPPFVGTAVHGTLDWDRRYRLMRTHTALHILCGVIFRDYGASVTGGNM